MNQIRLPSNFKSKFLLYNSKSSHLSQVFSYNIIKFSKPLFVSSIGFKFHIYSQVISKFASIVASVSGSGYDSCLWSGVRYMTGGLHYGPWRPFVMQTTFPTVYGTLPIVRTILRREKITLVHGHQAFSTLCHEALMHARTMGYKVVFTDHSLYGFSDVGSIHMNKVLQFSLADIDQAICVSHTSKKNTVLRSGLSPAKVFMIPNVVDTAIFKPAEEDRSEKMQVKKMKLNRHEEEEEEEEKDYDEEEEDRQIFFIFFLPILWIKFGLFLD